MGGFGRLFARLRSLEECRGDGLNYNMNDMKAVFLSYNQALTDRVNAILDEQGIRGFTRWALTEGRGSVDGEPHYGTHAWPSMNASILAVVEDHQVSPLLDAFRAMDAATKMQGSRAFVWPIEAAM